MSTETTKMYASAELLYAATSRCECGAGLPFAFYDIKSEGQPSARGGSTRPAEDNSEEGLKAQAVAKAIADIGWADKQVADQHARQQAELDESRARWNGIRSAAVAVIEEHGAVDRACVALGIDATLLRTPPLVQRAVQEL